MKTVQSFKELTEKKEVVFFNRGLSAYSADVHDSFMAIGAEASQFCDIYLFFQIVLNDCNIEFQNSYCNHSNNDLIILFYYYILIK